MLRRKEKLDILSLILYTDYMIFGSVCSGIEAASVAWGPLGWKAAWLSEIDKFPSRVLAHHYPTIPNLGDMTKLHANKTFLESRVDLLVGGTPCQSFSVAGLRKGLDDPRGNLCLEFLRLVDVKQPKWFVWENVPGVLSSSGGRDFGSFLGAVQKLGYGFCYRILDAQYFGVPQRRRRVFVVGYLGDYRPAAAVLFEPESLCGDSTKSRKKRQDVAPTISARTKGGGGLGTDFDLDGGLIAFGGGNTSGSIKIATAVNAKSTQRLDFETETLCVTGTRTHALKAEGFDASEDGTGRGQPIIAFQTKGSNLDIGEIHGTIGSNCDRASGSSPMVCIPPRAVCVNLRGRDGGSTVEMGGEISTALRASSGGGDKVHTPVKSRVRRLTPKECERLQGFPDDFTLLPGKEVDGPRYKALGNSMAVPVMRWIGERIQKVDEILRGNTD